MNGLLIANDRIVVKAERSWWGHYEMSRQLLSIAYINELCNY